MKTPRFMKTFTATSKHQRRYRRAWREQAECYGERPPFSGNEHGHGDPVRHDH
jgi:hypothetical protein